jgi:hypothetical protein
MHAPSASYAGVLAADDVTHWQLGRSCPALLVARLVVDFGAGWTSNFK